MANKMLFCLMALVSLANGLNENFNVPDGSYNLFLHYDHGLETYLRSREQFCQKTECTSYGTCQATMEKPVWLISGKGECICSRETYPVLTTFKLGEEIYGIQNSPMELDCASSTCTDDALKHRSMTWYVFDSGPPVIFDPLTADGEFVSNTCYWQTKGFDYGYVYKQLHVKVNDKKIIELDSNIDCSDPTGEKPPNYIGRMCPKNTISKCTCNSTNICIFNTTSGCTVMDSGMTTETQTVTTLAATLPTTETPYITSGTTITIRTKSSTVRVTNKTTHLTSTVFPTQETTYNTTNKQNDTGTTIALNVSYLENITTLFSNFTTEMDQPGNYNTTIYNTTLAERSSINPPTITISLNATPDTFETTTTEIKESTTFSTTESQTPPPNITFSHTSTSEALTNLISISDSSTEKTTRLMTLTPNSTIGDVLSTQTMVNNSTNMVSTQVTSTVSGTSTTAPNSAANATGGNSGEVSESTTMNMTQSSHRCILYSDELPSKGQSYSKGLSDECTMICYDPSKALENTEFIKNVFGKGKLLDQEKLFGIKEQFIFALVCFILMIVFFILWLISLCCICAVSRRNSDAPPAYPGNA